MKTIKYIIGIGAAIAALASCTKEQTGTEPVAPEAKMVEVTLSASQAMTKTSMATNGDILWSEGDQIAVTYSTGTYTFSLVSGEGSTNATFKGMILPDSGDPVSATYPVGEVALGDAQEYLEGTFADNTLPMSATYENGGLVFSADAAVVMTPPIGGFIGTIKLIYTVGETTYEPSMTLKEGDNASNLIFVVVPGAQYFELSNGSSNFELMTSSATEAGSRYVLDVPKYVASIGTADYATLAEAVAAAKIGDTIVLNDDIRESITIAAEKNIIINLNSHNITVEESKPAFLNYGTLKIEGIGNVSRSDNMGYVVDNQGTIEIAGGNYKKSAGTSQNALLRNASSMLISGGTFYAKYKNDGSNDNIYSANTVNLGLPEGHLVEFTMTGGEFITGTNGFTKSSGTVYHISGGKFTSGPNGFLTDGYGLVKDADGKYVVTSGFVAVDTKNTYYKTIENAFTTATTAISLIDNISGSVIIPENATSNYLYLNNHSVLGNITNNASATLILGESANAKATSNNGIVTGTISGNVLVTGGKYGYDPAAFVNKYEYKTSMFDGFYVIVDKTDAEKAQALANDGIVAITGSGSTLAYFTSVQAAWNASTSTTACYISLITDAEEDVVRVKKSAPIIKLEGHNFTGIMDTRLDGANKYCNVNGAGTVTFRELYCGNMTIDSKATVVIEDGIITGTFTVKSGSTLVIKGGTFAKDPTAYVIEGYEAVANADGTYSVTKTETTQE